MTVNRMFTIFAAAAILIASGCAASAQQANQEPAPPAAPESGNLVVLHELQNDDVVVQPFGVPAHELEDMDVYNVRGEKLGEIEDILTDASGKVIALSLEVGGFLGIGEREVIIMLDQVRTEGLRIVTSLGKKEIEALPTWKN